MTNKNGIRKRNQAFVLADLNNTKKQLLKSP